MSKTLTVLLFIFLFFVAGSLVKNQPGPTPVILWSTKKISWNDFLGIPDTNSKYNAMTYAQFSSSYKYSSDSMYCTIDCAFDPMLSWVKPNPNDDLLIHEQGHFDLTEYVARLFRKELQSHVFQSYETIKTEMFTMSQKYAELFDSIQDAYDEETNHSKVASSQKQWNQKIEQLLSELSAHSDPYLKIKIQYVRLE